LFWSFLNPLYRNWVTGLAGEWDLSYQLEGMLVREGSFAAAGRSEAADCDAASAVVVVVLLSNNQRLVSRLAL
jgi:hypothetical protein